MTRPEAEQAVWERWERLGLDSKANPTMFELNVLDELNALTQAEYRRVISECGRTVPQYSDQAGE